MSCLALVTILVATAAFVDSAPEWDDLRTTWGPNIFTKFNRQPRTVEEAKKQGFQLVGSDKCDATGAYNGVAYVKDNDFALTLLFDKNGFIAGVQHGITTELAKQKSYPSEKLQPPFVLVDNRYVITAYFTEPSKICTESRTQQQFNDEGTGTDLWIQIGHTPSDVTPVPKKESDLVTTKWTEGKCFVTMGKHYWYDIKVDMDCEAFFPVFLLYNGGKLNAFGWALFADLPSSHYEHPGVSVIGRFMKKVPECAQKISHDLSTMHIYLTSTPLLDFC